MPVLALSGDVYRVHATGQDIIKRALRLIGAIAPGESITGAQLTDALEALNDLLDAWNTEKLVPYALTRNTFTLTADAAYHEIGIGATLDVARPGRLLNGQAFLISSGTQEDPLAIITQAEFAVQRDSSTSTIPGYLYYEPSMPLGKIWLDPIPDSAYTLVLYLEQILEQVINTAQEMTLPPGYKEAIVHNLAIRLAPEYGRSAPAEVVATAVATKADLKRLNKRPLTICGDPASAPQIDGYVDSRAIQTGGM